MKIIVIVILLIMGSSSYAGAQEINLNIIREIESSNGKFLVSKKGALGAYQLMPAVVKDYNRITGAHVRFASVRDEKIGRRVAKWYLTVRLPQILKNNGIKKPSKEQILASYNGGHRRVVRRKKLAKETREYILKYRRLANAKSVRSTGLSH